MSDLANFHPPKGYEYLLLVGYKYFKGLVSDGMRKLLKTSSLLKYTQQPKTCVRVLCV